MSHLVVVGEAGLVGASGVGLVAVVRAGVRNARNAWRNEWPVALALGSGLGGLAGAIVGVAFDAFSGLAIGAAVCMVGVVHGLDL